MALLLGEDGRGYDLARKLESLGVWRTWLGDALYSSFIHCLTSPSSWDVFMSTDDSKSRAQIQLQLRVRALLFDKASASQLLRPPLQSSSSSIISKLNPNYLQLHGDDIYFSYEDCPQDEQQQQQQRDSTAGSKKPQQKPQSKASSVSVGSRYGGDKDMDNSSQRLRHDEFPETWYNQFFEKYRVTKPYRIASADQEGDKRTPEKMSSFIITNEKIKKRRAAFKEDETNNAINNRVTKSRISTLDETEAIDDDSVFFPEIMFPFNCVPSSTFPPMRRLEQNRKIDFNGILDSLPKMMAKNHTMIERLGIRPENMGMEQQGGNQFHGKAWDEGKRRQLSEKQASEMSRKVIARNLTEIGFDSSCKTSVDVLSQLLSSHTCKLGRVLRMLTDNYRKKCSAVELVKMFLQTTGYSNLGGLAEIVKDNSRNNPVQQTQQQQLQLIQSQLHPQFQAQLRQSQQQVTRQMHPQMQMQMQQIQLQMQMQQMQQQQMAQPQNLVFQQQQQQQMERIRRRQPAAAAAAAISSSTTTTTTTTTTNSTPRTMVQVKLENPSEFTPSPMETNNNNTFGGGATAAAGGMMNIRHPHQLQFQQHHQIAAMSNFQAQSTNQYRQSAILPAATASHHQIPQVQTPTSNNGGNSSLMRAQPVKVEGFQELMGGDLATIKLDNNSSAEGNGKITSPPLPQPPK
ncbi:uncharacterized protein LOC124923974 isoform X2 [Impatiens glandulifera]|uniref:uncharacterized protein LOC124923974 isoform X2 n=1 Tax=Impatiens glandulifera TaxID=253017 RepID=UPI001FB16099|nr:uncharacterized protein LOC124923974 isoform X2 [Impatiens glandulifera]